MPNPRIDSVALVTNNGKLHSGRRSLDDQRLRLSRGGLDDCRFFRRLGRRLGLSRRVLKQHRRQCKLAFKFAAALDMTLPPTIVINRRSPTAVAVVDVRVVFAVRAAPAELDHLVTLGLRAPNLSLAMRFLFLRLLVAQFTRHRAPGKIVSRGGSAPIVTSTELALE